MKAYIKIIIGAILIGSMFAFLFYRDISSEVVALTTKEYTVNLFQVGVFKDYDNALNYQNKYSPAIIYEDNSGYYRVIIGLAYHEENKVNNDGLYYKKITDFCKVFDENEYIKVPHEINKNSEHFHLYKNNELLGILLLTHIEKDYTIQKIWLKEEKYFIPFVFTLYWNISLKINPITFILKGKKYLLEAKKMKFENKKGSYILDMNPRNLDAYLKKEKII